MVKLYNPWSQAVMVRDRMNANANGQYRAWTRDDLAKANQKSLLHNNVIGIMLFGGLALGGLVGLGDHLRRPCAAEPSSPTSRSSPACVRWACR